MHIKNLFIHVLLMIVLFSLLSASCTGYNFRSLREADFKEKIAVLPFANLSDNKDALTHVMPHIRSILENKGIEVVDEESINNFLCELKVRHDGYISGELATKIKDKFNAKTILTGSIIAFENEENPLFGITARLIESSNGQILWTNYFSAAGDDYSGILGLGTVEEIDILVSRVADILLKSLTTERLVNNRESAYRIAVMPFHNTSRSKNAGMKATYMFIDRLFNNDAFDPVEYGKIRKTVVDNRIRFRGTLDYKNIKTISETLGVDLILVGTVEQYSDGKDTSSPPEVTINARLLDPREKRILWYDVLFINGEEDLIAFDWGNIRSVDKLAYKAVSELVKKAERAKWY